MEPDSNDLRLPPPSPPTTAPVHTCSLTTFDWRHWARRLLVCNPFFLCSAALLLFGVNRLSLDPDFLGEEQANLLFNYGALQFYEFLVVGTAIILARRKVWYKSALLVVVEHGLLLIPFLLLTQSALLKPGLGMTLAIAAVALAALRAMAIHRGFPQFNLPPRALVLGGALLLVNAALALTYPPAVEKNTDDWAVPNLLLWYVALPGLAAGANLLPGPKHYGGLNPERHWLPLFIYGLWIAGTGVHIWCLGYISKIEFQIYGLGPTAVVIAWTMMRRISDCVPDPGTKWEIALLSLTFAAPLVAFGNPGLFEVLVLLNAALYALVFRRRSGASRTLLRELIFASVALLVLGVPEEFARIVLPNFVRAHAVILAIACAVFISALRWFRVPIGLAGTVAMPTIVALVWPAAPFHALIHTALVFLLAHSLAWRRDTPGATFLRTCAGIVWFADAAAWVHQYPWRTDASVTAAALILLAAYFAIWRVSKQRPDLAVAASAGAVSVCAPADWLLRYGSAGLNALAASMFLFAIGFAVAWTRHQWERSHGPARH